MYFLSYRPLGGQGPGLAGALIATLILAACGSAELAGHIAAVSRPQGEGIYKIGEPYRINGVWYHPAEDFTYDRTGIASWYGPGFHGQLTANGEIYDQNALTAAHPTLQMPCLVRVTNLDNGRSVVVRVNDRGPFASGRIIDVSQRAAELLGFRHQGTARVRVRVLTEESQAIAMQARGGGGVGGVGAPVMAAVPRGEVQVAALPTPAPSAPAAMSSAALVNGTPRAATAEAEGIFVQAGAFAVYDNASRLRDRLAPLAVATISPLTRGDGSTLYLVQLGPLGSTEQADEVLAGVIDRGHADARIVVK